MYTKNRTFEWDDLKARKNALKHGITFFVAAAAFDDPFYFIMDDSKHSSHEPRQWLIGDCGSGILVVVFTLRPPNKIRIITARRASRNERRTYECAE